MTGRQHEMLQKYSGHMLVEKGGPGSGPHPGQGHKEVSGTAKANEKSAAAQAATEHADSKYDPKLYTAAAQAHRAAAKHHNSVAVEHDHAGNKKEAVEARSKATAHLTQAKEHNDTAREMRSQAAWDDKNQDR